MALFSNLFKNTIFQPIAKISNVFTLPFQILQSAIQSTVTLIDKIFDPFNLFDINQLTSKDSVFKKIAELTQHEQALSEPTALRSSIINILNSKSGVLGLPSTSISGIADKIQQALSSGKLFGGLDTIIKKVQNIFDFGTIFDTPKAVFEKIADLIGGALSGGSLIDTIGKLIKSTADLFNLPSIDSVISKIQEYIDLGVIFDGVGNLIGKIKDIFDFGEILDTAESVITKIGTLILENVITPAIPIVEKVIEIINAKADLLGLPNLSDVISKISEYINIGAIADGLGTIIQTIKNIFNGDDQNNSTDPDNNTGINNDSIYEVFNNSQIINEQIDGGTDTVKAHISYTLGDNLENLELQGNSNLNGTGNVLDNILTGNLGNNILSGLDGNDILIATGGSENTLIGGTGHDQLYGSNGNETYEFERGLGFDTIFETGGNDTIKLGSNIEFKDLMISEQADGLYIHINDASSTTGETDLIVIKDWAKGEQHQVESIQLANGDRVDLQTLELQPNYYF